MTGAGLLVFQRCFRNIAPRGCNSPDILWPAVPLLPADSAATYSCFQQTLRFCLGDNTTSIAQGLVGSGLAPRLQTRIARIAFVQGVSGIACVLSHAVKSLSVARIQAAFRISGSADWL